MRKIIEILLCIFIALFLLGIIAMGIQVIGEDSPQKASIIGGLLSMVGGAIGALSAFLIARMQLTKQLELQDKKNREMFLVELKIKRAEEALGILYETRMAYFDLKGSWDTYVSDCDGFSGNLSGEKFDKDKLKNEPIIIEFNIKRDKFIHTYNKIYTLRPHFKELIYRIIGEQDYISNH